MTRLYNKALRQQNTINPTPEMGCLKTETETTNQVAIKARGIRSVKMHIAGGLSDPFLGFNRRERSPEIVKKFMEYSTIPWVAVRTVYGAMFVISRYIPMNVTRDAKSAIIM